MNAFAGVSLEDIHAKYKLKQSALVADLRKAGLLPVTAPNCHGPMVVRGLRPYTWRCTDRSCKKEESLLKNSLFGDCRKPYEAFKALYLWATEHCPKDILQEVNLSPKTLRKLLVVWRQAICVFDESSPAEGNIVECDETFIGKRKYERGVSHY